MSTDFSTFFLELGITHAPRTKWSPWSIGNIELQNKHLSGFFCCYLSEAGNDWAKLVREFVFACKISVNSNTGTTPYAVVFGFKAHVSISLELGIVRNDNDLSQSGFCQSLLNHSHMDRNTNHSCLDILLTSKSSMDLRNRETQFKRIIIKCIESLAKSIIVLYRYRNMFKK